MSVPAGPRREEPRDLAVGDTNNLTQTSTERFPWGERGITKRTYVDKRIVWQGKYLQAVLRDGYECIERCNIKGIVGIIAVTDDRRLILVEQFRPPVQARVIELPAGLAGDTAQFKDETLETAARRELLEETGYQAGQMVQVAHGAASAGLSDEMITLMLATGLIKVGDGGGDEHEDITVHEVPLDGLMGWLQERQAKGTVIDLKIYSALAFCQQDPHERA